jgi:DUF438 domain-containing protein
MRLPMPVDSAVLTAILDSLKDPVVLADTGHTVCYMNKAAEAHYEEGRMLLGRSVMACHNAASNAVIREVFAALENGEDERLITDSPERRIYMRAVRDADGKLIGYYERYEPKARAARPADTQEG